MNMELVLISRRKKAICILHYTGDPPYINLLRTILNAQSWVQYYQVFMKGYFMFSTSFTKNVNFYLTKV
jgi:hypothetical protein